MIQLNIGWRTKQRTLKRRNSNDQKTFKELLNILDNQENANQNDTILHISGWLRSKIVKTAYVGEDMDSK